MTPHPPSIGVVFYGHSMWSWLWKHFHRVVLSLPLMISRCFTNFGSCVILISLNCTTRVAEFVPTNHLVGKPEIQVSFVVTLFLRLLADLLILQLWDSCQVPPGSFTNVVIIPYFCSHEALWLGFFFKCVYKNCTGFSSSSHFLLLIPPRFYLWSKQWRFSIVASC